MIPNERIMNNQTATVRNTVFAAVILLFAMTLAMFELGRQRFALAAVSHYFRQKNRDVNRTWCYGH